MPRRCEHARTELTVFLPTGVVFGSIAAWAVYDENKQAALMMGVIAAFFLVMTLYAVVLPAWRERHHK